MMSEARRSWGRLVSSGSWYSQLLWAACKGFSRSMAIMAGRVSELCIGVEGEGERSYRRRRG
jgi:hypothetical protein